MKSLSLVKFKLNSFIENPFLPLNPLILRIPLIYGVTKILEFLHCVETGFWSKLWVKIVFSDVSPNNFTRDNVHNAFVYGSPFKMAIFLWSVSAVLIIAGKSGILKKYKIQPDDNISPGQMLKALPVIIFNQIVTSIVFLKFMFFLMENVFIYKMPEDFLPQNVPSFTWLMAELCIDNLIQEFIQFYVHRFLHSKHIYKHVHRHHHDFPTIPVGAMYNHPVEFFFNNLFPGLFGLVIIKAHFPTYFIWSIIHPLTTLLEHYNYHVPLLNSPHYHNYHHLYPSRNYGLTGLMDTIYGIDKHFRSSKFIKNHKTIWPFITTVDYSEAYNKLK